MTVSILIPAYNAAAFLPKCLDSVLNQTYQDLQVVIVDDGSKDNTLEVCREYAAKDSRIEYYEQENRGVASTRNYLLKLIKGDYVLFVDADDWIELDMVEYLCGLAVKDKSGFIMCDRVINDTEPTQGEPTITVLSQEKAVEDFIHHDYFIGSLCNKLIDTHLMKGLEFRNDISYGEDALFIWRVLQNVDNVVVTSKQLYHYRMNEESISHQSFGEKKLTGHKTWAILTNEVEEKWPKYTDLVHGVFARSDMYLLQAAAQSGYPKDEHIKELQRNVRKNYKFLGPILRHDLKQLFYATMIMFWYGFGKVYYALYKLRRL